MPTDPHQRQDTQRRVPALDGIRGVLTVMVVISHYFAELPGGMKIASVGWIAVDAFFVLSGLLVGRLILDKGHHLNFFKVFYARRMLRTFPIYFACITSAVLAGALASALPEREVIPTWSYFAFVQNAFMAQRHDVGVAWLAPTWTLAVEEQFYLVVPALMLALPRRWMMPALSAVALGSVLSRAVLVRPYGIEALTLLPCRADSLAIGLMAAVLLAQGRVDGNTVVVRALAPILLLAGVLSERIGLLMTLGHTAVSIAAAALLVSLIADAPEAARFKGKVLVVLGNTSFATYLTHLPILWAAHALVRHAEPSLTDAAGWAVSIGCLPITAMVAWLATRYVEAPISAKGRRFKWDDGSAAVASAGALVA